MASSMALRKSLCAAHASEHARRAIHEARAVSRSSPVGLPAGVLENLAARRIGVSRVMPAIAMACELTKAAWPLACVSSTGLCGRDAVERGVQGKAFHVGVGRMVPFALMPAAAHDPIARPRLAGGAGYLGDDFVPRARFAKIEAHAIFAERSEVAVPFDEPRNGEHPVKVDHPGLRTDPASRIAIRAHRRNPPAAHRHQLSERQSGIHSGDFAISQHQIGRLSVSHRRKRGAGRQYRNAHVNQNTAVEQGPGRASCLRGEAG